MQPTNKVPALYQPLASYILSRHDIDHEKLENICSFFHPVKAARNQVLISYNDTCRAYYFINTGSLRVFTLNNAGVETSKTWSAVAEKVTDSNGRISDFLSAESANEGIYKLTFLTAAYFKKQKIESFYPFIEVVFEIKGSKHYHVPITLSAYGYSTYRGN